MNTSEERALSAHQRRSNGDAWETIASDLGYGSVKSAKAAVRRYANRHGWKWPLDPPPAPNTGIPIAGYASHPEAAYKLRQLGLKWQDVGARINLHSPNAHAIAMRYARKYANRHGLGWPPPIDKSTLQVPEGGQAAYDLRTTGKSWLEVGRTTRLGARARGRAERYAEIKGQPWPIVFETMAERAYRLKRDNPHMQWREIAGKSGYSHSHHAGVAARRIAAIVAGDWMVEHQGEYEDAAELATAAWKAVGIPAGEVLEVPSGLVTRAVEVLGG